jgi:hypothetical protein
VEQGFSPALKQETESALATEVFLGAKAQMIADLYAGLKACATPHVVKF